MTVNVNTQKALGGNNPISLKGTANNGIAGWFEGPTSAVKFSDYYRKTSTDLTKANFESNNNSNFVPDATENATVPTSGAISFSDFRGDGDNGVIKLYAITQSGNNSKLDLDGQSWNSNLNKNVPKVANINGRLTSDTAPTTQDGSGYNHKTGAALAFDAEAYNLNIIVDTGTGDVNNYNNATGVFGMGGAGGNINDASGKRGGTAMFIQQNSNSSNAVTNGSGIINVNTNSGRLFAGGGGGEAGRSGTAGNTAACRFFTTSGGNTVTNSGFTIRGYNSCNNDPGAHCSSSVTVHGVIGKPNVMAGGGWRGTSCNGSGGRSRCRGGGRFRGDAGNMGCYNTINKICKYRHLFAGNTGNAGSGGNGGIGQGANGAAGGGNAGNNGGTASCNDPSGGNVTIETIGTPTSGNAGSSGQAGGNFGSAGTSTNERSGSGGQSGFALFTNTSNQVKLSNTNNNRGVVNANVI